MKFRLLFFLCLPSLVFSFALDDLSLEEKVGQMLIVHFHGYEANEDAKQLIQEAKVGGFIYYNWSNGLDSKEQVKQLSQSLQVLSKKWPLFLTVDQEGGRVQRLRNGFIKIPSALEIATTLSPSKAEELAYSVGLELKEAGININLAPVVDVNVNPANPVIGNRSFGNNPETVITYGGAMMKGYKRAGIISTLKHFPGHGDVTIDSHFGLPIVNKSRKDLDQVELKPFQELSQEAEAVVTAHILFPTLDAGQPATSSSKILKTLLRKELGFQGVVLSDSLVMKGILDRYASVEEAAIASILAGCDIIVLGGAQLTQGVKEFELQPKDIFRIHRAIVNAVQKGIIPEDSIDEAVERILTLKEKL